MDRAGRGEAADAPDLDIDDPPRPGDQRLARIGGRADALVKADRRHDLALHLRMVVDVVKGQGLLDIVEREGVHRLQQREVIKPVIGIRVHGQLDRRKRLAHCGEEAQIMTAPDLQLDAAITGLDRDGDAIKRGRDIGDAKADPDLDL
ncbi:hypothetical protein D3C76_1457060 [compost metagenome]